jgi:ATP-dependent RNA helicase DeaD
MDHMERGTLRFDDLKMVILDECDRMLDMGFRDDIEQVMSGTPPGRQSLFFSATLPPAIRTLIKRYTDKPAEVKIQALAQNAPRVEQVYYEVQRRAKVEALTRLIDRFDFRHGIVFCSTKIMVDELDEMLHARGYATDRLHGDITQAQRSRVTEKFKRKGFEFLIATDVAARGLDVDDLEVVFNFDLPNDAEDYTHRIGRTGRAGKSGKAFTFVSNREIYKLQSMIRYGKLNIQRGRIPSIDEIEEARENKFFEKLRETLEAGEFVKQERMIDRLLEQGHASTDIASALIHLMQGVTSEPPPPPPEPAKPRFDRDDRGGSKPKPKFERGPRKERHEKPQHDRPGRTGREAGYVTIFINVGRKQLITPSDLVGKIAGVTRQPGSIVGAIDLKQRHSLVDVTEQHADAVLQKLAGVRIKGVTLQPVPAAQMG